MSREKPAKSAQSHYKNVSEKMTEEIQNGNYSEGDKIPSVRELASRLEVSPSTVQRAYAALETQGFIESVPGQGYFVSSLRGEIEPSTTMWKVFFSYAKKDDVRTNGDITRLKHAIENEYGFLTGRELSIFFDQDDIAWGENWRESINENLGETHFFIPIITPTYLQRPHCLSELKYAVNSVGDTRGELGVFPIFFTDCSQALDNLNDDSIASFLEDHQREDWSSIHYKDSLSEDYRVAVRALVNRMIGFDKELVQKSVAQVGLSQSLMPDESFDEEFGYLDLIVEFTDSSGAATEVMEKLSGEIDAIGSAVSSEHIDSKMSFSEKLLIIRRVAERLADPADNYVELCKRYSTLINRLDHAFFGVVDMVRREMTNHSAADKLEIAGFFDSIVNLYNSVQIPFQQTRSFRDSLVNLEKLSKDLRRPVKRIRRATDDFISSERYYENWKMEALELSAELSAI